MRAVLLQAIGASIDTTDARAPGVSIPVLMPLRGSLSRLGVGDRSLGFSLLVVVTVPRN